MDESNTDVIIQFFGELEDRLLGFMRYIPFNEENNSVILPLLSSIIVEAGSLIDTIFREEYLHSPKPKKDLTISDFAPYYEKNYYFSKKRTLLFIYPPSYIIPFVGWIDENNSKYKTINWWQNYNKLKHSRIENIKLSTLNTAVNAMCALHQIISQLPTFVCSLIRYDMISCGSWGIDYIKEQLISGATEVTVLIETKLFATPSGRYSFPENVIDIHPIKFGQSKKLSRLLGREI